MRYLTCLILIVFSVAGCKKKQTTTPANNDVVVQDDYIIEGIQDVTIPNNVSNTDLVLNYINSGEKRYRIFTKVDGLPEHTILSENNTDGITPYTSTLNFKSVLTPPGTYRLTYTTGADSTTDKIHEFNLHVKETPANVCADYFWQSLLDGYQLNGAPQYRVVFYNTNKKEYYYRRYPIKRNEQTGKIYLSGFSLGSGMNTTVYSAADTNGFELKIDCNTNKIAIDTLQGTYGSYGGSGTMIAGGAGYVDQVNKKYIIKITIWGKSTVEKGNTINIEGDMKL